MRWPALAAGLVLVGVAFFAAGRVADTREGLVYEVITLLGGLAGVSLILYGLFANTGEHVRPASTRSPVSLATPPPVQSANDLLLGGSGLLVAAILVIGIGINAGPPWALLGLVLLLPMVTGCAYLCFRFLRAPEREWRIDLERLTRHR